MTNSNVLLFLGCGVVVAVMQVLILDATRRLRVVQQNITAELSWLRRMRELDGEALAHLKEQDQTITGHVNAGFVRLQQELRSHTTSDLLHAPERFGHGQ